MQRGFHEDEGSEHHGKTLTITPKVFPKLAAVGPRAFRDYPGTLSLTGPFDELRFIGAAAFRLRKPYCINCWKKDEHTHECSERSKGQIKLLSLKKLEIIHADAFMNSFSQIWIEGEFPSLQIIGADAFRNTGARSSKISFPNGLPRLQEFRKRSFEDFYGELHIAGRFPILKNIQKDAFAWTEADDSLHPSSLPYNKSILGSTNATLGGVMSAKGAAEKSSRIHFKTGLEQLLFVWENAFGLFPGDLRFTGSYPALKRVASKAFFGAGTSKSELRLQQEPANDAMPNSYPFRFSFEFESERGGLTGSFTNFRGTLSSFCPPCAGDGGFGRCVAAGAHGDGTHFHRCGCQTCRCADLQFNCTAQNLNCCAPPASMQTENEMDADSTTANSTEQHLVPSNTDGSLNTSTVIAVAVAVVLVILAIPLAVTIAVKTRRSRAISRLERAATAASFFDTLLAQARDDFAQSYPRLYASDDSQPCKSDAVVLVAPNDLSYVGRDIARGRFSVVHVAHLRSFAADALNTDPQHLIGNNEGVLAVKQLQPEFERDLAAVNRFLRKSCLLLSLQHPNIVKVLGFVRSQSPIAVVMDHYENGDLKKFLRQCRPMLAKRKVDISVTDLCDIAVRVASAAEFLESRHIVHRDIQAKNVLVGRTIADIRLAHLGESRDIYKSEQYISVRCSSHVVALAVFTILVAPLLFVSRCSICSRRPNINWCVRKRLAT